MFQAAQTEVLGEWRSAPMVAFGTLKRLSAWKMYCRANNVPFDAAQAVANQLKRYETDLRYADDDATIDVYDYVPEKYHELARMSEKYLGVIDSISPHPCAHVLCQEDIRREIGIIRINGKTGKKKPVYVALIDGATAEVYGYLKNDFLHVDVVKVNREVFQRVGVEQPDVQELLRLTDGDAGAWRMYAEGLTMGLNQVEKPKTREKVMQYQPRNITELSAFVAAVRPGFKSMLQIFLERRHFDYGIPVFDNLIQTREMQSSFLIYQEQVMKTLQYAGFSAPESYAAIKAIAKKHPEKVLPLKERLIQGFSARILEDDKRCSAEQALEMTMKVWQIMEDATNYSFNSCLAGTERIRRTKGGKSKFSPTIEEMYRIRHDKAYACATGHLPLHDKYKRCGYGYALSMFSDGRIRQNRIVDIYDSGIAQTYRLRMVSGATIMCTRNHKFPTPYGDKRLDELRVSDELFLCGAYDDQTLQKYRFTNGNYSPNYPHQGQCGFQKKPNGPSVLYYKIRGKHVADRLACQICGEHYTEDMRFELHHLDFDRTNNQAENLRWCCVSCHKKAHYENGRTKRHGKGYPT